MNRCNAFNKNNKKCRCIIKDNKLFCSDSHKPINDEIINDGCFMCMENIVESKDIIYFKCKHAFHKNCIRNAGGIRIETCPICRASIISETICKSYSQYKIEDGIKYKKVKMKHSTKRKKKSMKSRNISKTKNRTHKSKKKRIY